MKLVAALFACLAVAGCQSAEQMAAKDDALCPSYGATRGSDSYVQCRTSQQVQRTMIRAAILQSN
jgi:hypothetical protein